MLRIPGYPISRPPLARGVLSVKMGGNSIGARPAGTPFGKSRFSFQSRCREGEVEIDTRVELQDRATWLCGEKRCEETIAVLEEILEQGPEDPDVNNQLGICYSGGCTEHLMVQPDLALEHFRSAQASGGDKRGTLSRARVLSSRGHAYRRSKLLPHGACLRAAVECHESAAALYLDEGRPEGWAGEQYHLGNLWCEMPAKEVPDKWQRAISHYRSALQVRTPRTDPVGWAAVQQNLGTAYREVGAGERPDSVGKAIRCYRLALRVFTRDEFPLRYATLHNNLGNAYLSLPAADEAGIRRRVRLALRHFDVALSIRTRAGSPTARAITQFNRGNAFLRLAEVGSVRKAALRQAEKCFRDAEACCRRCGGTDHTEPTANCRKRKVRDEDAGPLLER
jgi:tetratricopeptide (TPR) repeat protein